MVGGQGFPHGRVSESNEMLMHFAQFGEENKRSTVMDTYAMRLSAYFFLSRKPSGFPTTLRPLPISPIRRRLVWSQH